MQCCLSRGLSLLCLITFCLSSDTSAQGGDATAQVWSRDVVERDVGVDFRPPPGPLRPLVIVGTRNGAFSARVVVASAKPISKIHAEMSDLSQPGGKGEIPASAVQVRYALPNGLPTRWRPGDGTDYPRLLRGFDGLDVSPPQVVPVMSQRYDGRKRLPLDRALQPIWITVKVPANAMPGDYKGKLSVRIDEFKPLVVPVELKVYGWKLPEPHDFRTFVGMIESPETLALEYNVPLWSDEHWKLVEKSLKLLGQVGDKTTYIPLICQTNQGNEQSMVRWIKKGDGKYAYDFSVMHKYLDLVEKHVGKPEVLCFYAWECYLEGGGTRNSPTGNPSALEAFKKIQGTGPMVTLLDPATGRTETMELPEKFTSPEGRAVWKPFYAELTKQLERRKLLDVTALGVLGDREPPEEVFAAFSDFAPGVPWVKESHNVPGSGALPIPARYRYCALLWAHRFVHDKELRYGWKRPDLRVHYPRTMNDSNSLLTFRLMGEMNTAGSQRGFGRIGADLWPVLRNRRGNRTGRIASRYPHSSWWNLNLKLSLLAPGAAGPVATQRFEMMREGLQESEARIFIETALTDDKLRARLGEKLAKACQDMLGERNRAILHGFGITQPDNWRDFYRWFGGDRTFPGEKAYVSTWQERSSKLYAAATEVAGALGINDR